MKSNRGFSLVELIVVIALMAILTGVGVISVGMIGGFKATECSKNIESLLNKVRIDTMGKNSAYVHIYQAADGSYYAEYVTKAGSSTNTSTVQIGKKSVNVTYADESDLTNFKAVDSVGIYLQFERSSGALMHPEAAPMTSRVVKIKVTQNSKVIVISIYPETGKISSEVL